MTTFRGLFLTCDDPDLTAKFYREVAGLALEQIGNPERYAYWKCDKNGIQFTIHEAKRFADYAYPVCEESNNTHLYFKIESQENFLEHLRELNIKYFDLDDVVVTVVDPDGRKVMFGTA